MKRVGKRGEGKWQRISFEQLIAEVVEGDLFGEGMWTVCERSAIWKHRSTFGARGWGRKPTSCW